MATTSVTAKRKHIDVHVHCRDWAESAKATISQVKRLSESQGIVAICDMPNTKPAITTADLVERRFRTAESQGVTNGYYLYIGATADPGQISEAARIATDHPKVVGIKLYAGKSTGDLAVINEQDQFNIYTVLAREKYKGILAVHCEEEGLAMSGLWNPVIPATWNLAKPPEMEIVGVEKQILFASHVGFEGHLHICHTSTPEAVEMVNDARSNLRISCGSTPHHLMFSTDEMQEVGAMRFKVNPPIRDRRSVLQLNNLLRAGKIDWIETDHAPHKTEEKKYDWSHPKEFYMSGIRSLETYSAFLDILALKGFSEKQIDDLTYGNVKKVFTKIVE